MIQYLNNISFFLRKKFYKYKKNIVSRLYSELNQINFVEFIYSGSKVYHDNKKDHVAVIKTTLVNGSHNFSFCSQARKLELIYHNKKSEFLIVDLGGHIGCTSLYYAKKFPKSKIISVEPFQKNFEFLKRNLEFHNNKILLECAIGCESNLGAKFYDNQNDSWGFGLLKMSSSSVEIGKVNIICLAELLKEYETTDNFVLKIDIEGSEKLIFEDKRNWQLIDTFQVVIVEIHDWMFPGEKTAKGLQSWAVEFNRDVCISGENLWFFKHLNFDKEIF